MNQDENGDDYRELLREYWITYPRIKIGNGKDVVGDLPFVKVSTETIGVGKAVNDNAEIFNDYNDNKAYGSYAHAEGKNNKAGIMGYKILDFYMGEEGCFIKLDTELEGPFYESGDILTIMCDSAKYPNSCTITSNMLFEDWDLNTWHITVDAFPFETFDLSKNYYLYVINKPNEGNTYFGDGAHAEGYGTHAVEFSSHAEGVYTKALGQYSHAEGDSTIAMGHNTHAEGYNNYSVQNYSHTEGMSNVSGGQAAHAEGRANQSLGRYSHTEGYSNIAEGEGSHVEGGKNEAYGKYAHAEGYLTVATSDYTHTEGYKTTVNNAGGHAEGRVTTVNGLGGHAEGINTVAEGEATHSEGKNTTAEGNYSHAEGYNTRAAGVGQHVQGQYNIIDASYAHIVGNGSSSTKRSNAHTLDWSGNAWFAGKVSDKDGQLLTQQDLNNYATKTDLNEYTTKEDLNSYVEKTELNNYVIKTELDNYITNDKLTSFGKTLYITAGKTKASTIGEKATAEGASTVSTGTASHAEGYKSEATKNYAHAEGYNSHADGNASHSEGNATYAYGNNSHSEGLETIANAASSHVEGYGSVTKVSGAAGDYWASHAEGRLTTADGAGAHSEGYGTIASGTASHAEGYQTAAKGRGQHVEGQYNIIDVKKNAEGQMLNSKNKVVETLEEAAPAENYVHIVGNGTETARSNAHTIDWSGNGWFSGNVKIGGTGQDDAAAKLLATQEYVDNKVSSTGSGVYVGSGTMPENCNVQIDPTGEVITVENLANEVAELIGGGSSANITPESIGAVPREEVGNVQEIFPVYFYVDYEEENIKYYTLYFDNVIGENLDFLGKTIIVETYADANMEYWFNSDTTDLRYQINPNAEDLTINPESGICTIEIQIPDEFWGEYEGRLVIPYLVNDYVEFKSYHKKASLWQEIKNMSQNTVIASGEYDGYFWRKWGNGVAEVFGSKYFSSDDLYFNDQGTISTTITLPIIINPTLEHSHIIQSNMGYGEEWYEVIPVSPIIVQCIGGSSWSLEWSVPEGKNARGLNVHIHLIGHW